MLLFTFYVVYIVIVCIVFLALRDFGGRRFISTILLLYYYYISSIFGSEVMAFGNFLNFLENFRFLNNFDCL